MFTDWLRGLQDKLDIAEREGILKNFDKNNETIKTADLKIAYSLVCSYGNNYDCSRVNFTAFLTNF